MKLFSLFSLPLIFIVHASSDISLSIHVMSSIEKPGDEATIEYISHMDFICASSVNNEFIDFYMICVHEQKEHGLY